MSLGILEPPTLLLSGRCEGHKKGKRERLCRYIARSAVTVPRLSLSFTHKVLYSLTTPYRHGTIQVAFDPVDFMALLAAVTSPCGFAGFFRIFSRFLLI
jgi:hypothetical protein